MTTRPLPTGQQMVSFACPDDLADRLTETARRLDLSRSKLLRLTVLALVDAEEAKAEAARLAAKRRRSEAIKRNKLSKRIDKLVNA